MSIPTDQTIANFPFLTQDEFEDVCKACLPLFQENSGSDTSISAKLVKDARRVDHVGEERTYFLSILTHRDLHSATGLESNDSGEHDVDRFSGIEDDLDEV